jgi:hypothetical protein
MKESVRFKLRGIEWKYYSHMSLNIGEVLEI